MAGTLEAEAGNCLVIGSSDSLTGVCVGTVAEQCSSTPECQAYFAVSNAECVDGFAEVPICVATGCNYQADCDPGFFCATSDGDLCLDASLL